MQKISKFFAAYQSLKKDNSNLPLYKHKHC